ncbi:MAG: lactate racemase domain-containing protein [Spirochaetia bacterium]
MLYYAEGSATSDLSLIDLETGLRTALDSIGTRNRVLAVPPDFTRVYSQAGPLTEAIYRHYGERLAGVLPAIGTHTPMTTDQTHAMFPSIPKSLFRVHNWRDDIVTLGRIESQMVRELSEGRLNYDWPAQVNRMLADGSHDLVLSIGQVVPHEVTGMANFNKNIFVGTGGSEAIGKSHYLGAVYGMERIMGHADSPVRAILNEASRRFGSELPVVYILTVVESVPQADGAGARLVVRGLFVGDDTECFYRAAGLARDVNVKLLPRAPRKIVAYMDPNKYHSTWLANKAIYRSRMAIADGGELVVIAPGVKHFGEDAEIDRLIARHGYHGTQAALDAVDGDPELAGSLGTAAHLIHSSTDGRFGVTYAAGGLADAQISAVGFDPMSVEDATARYRIGELTDGWNTLPGGEEVYYLSNPALGLWALERSFNA